MNNLRIDLTDSLATILHKLCEGNPGALTVLMQCAQESPKIDPDGALGSFGPLLQLDMLGVYGADIWMLYKDVCGQDLLLTLAVLRAHQLGFCTESDIAAAIRGAAGRVDPALCLNYVQQELPSFGRA